MSENLKQQVIVELNFHQQEVDRLTKVLALLEDLGYPRSSGGTVPEGSTLKLYKRRSQSPEAKARISAYQKRKWSTIRAVQSGAVTLESLPPDQRAMIEHVAGVAIHPTLTDKSAGISKADTGISATKSPHAAMSATKSPQEPSRDVTKAKRLRTR
jgi:hypothetical protein